jgi:tetratricopeptide (TPR) repeat protein
MPEKTVTDIGRELRELYQKGTVALQRQNFEYAIAIFNQVLAREPAFFECRQALRVAQFKEQGGKTSFFKKIVGGASSSPMVAKGQMALRKNPLEAIQIAEQILNGDPTNSAAHKLLAEAAMEAGLPQTACLSLEILLRNSSKDFDLSMQYGKALAAAGQPAKAEVVYTELMKAHPNRGEIADALKDLSARTTLNEGGYEALADGKGSYRDILKNKAESEQLEQEKREVKSEDVAQRLITEYEQRLPKEPNNLKLLRSLAELYAQKKQFDRAIEYCERIRSSEGGADPSLDRLISDIKLKKFDESLAQLDATAPDYSEQMARIQAQRDEYQMNETKSRAERYPTDLQIRFDLGELYLKSGKINEAIQEFQKAKNYPAKRLQAMGYLGQCFARRGMNDMAASTLQNAIKEKPVFDDEKKELVYQLGSVLEKMNKPEEAIEQFKQIYEIDIGYKDVAAKVDKYYSGQ